MARLIDESFEGTGYEESWSETIGSGCTIDEDSSGPGTLPTNAGSQCLRIVKAASAVNVWTWRQIGNQGNLWFRIYLYIDSESLSNGQSYDLIAALFTSASDTAAGGVKLEKTAGGQLQFVFNYNNGSWNDLGSVNISTGQWYCVEYYHGYASGAVQAWVNNVSVGSVSGQSLSRVAASFVIGPRWGGANGLTMYADLLVVDDAQRVGPESSGAALEGSATGSASAAGDLSGGTPVFTPVAVTTSSSIPSNAVLGIPRRKMVASADGQTLVICHGSSGVNDVWRSTDGGLTWTSLGTLTLDYHASLDVDSSGRIFIGSRNGASGIAWYRRYNGSSWETAQTWNDYGAGTDGSTASVLKGNGSDVWLFFRASFAAGTNPDRMYWRRSTDNGATFDTNGTLFHTASDNDYKRMGGLMLSGQPAVSVWELDTGNSRCNIRLFRWDGSQFTELANSPLYTAVANASTRYYEVVQTDNGTIHCVWSDEVGGQPVIRHAYRTLAGSWSSPATILTATSTLSDPAAPSLVSYGNSLLLLYSDTKGATRQLYSRTYIDGTWSGSDQTISSSGNGGVQGVSSLRNSPTSMVPYIWDQGGATRTVYFSKTSLGATVVKKLKLLLKSTSVDQVITKGTVLAAPTTEPLHGAAVGQFSGSYTITAGAGDDTGKAVLKVPAADFSGGALNVGANVRAYVESANGFSSLHAGTVIEE